MKNLSSIQKGYLNVYNKFDSIGNTINNGINKVTSIFKSGMSGTDELHALKDVSSADLAVGKAVANGMDVAGKSTSFLEHLQKLNFLRRAVI